MSDPRPIFKDSSGHYCVEIDHPASSEEFVTVDFVRQEPNGGWVVWQRGSVNRSLLEETEFVLQ